MWCLTLKVALHLQVPVLYIKTEKTRCCRKDFAVLTWTAISIHFYQGTVHFEINKTRLQLVVVAVVTAVFKLERFPSDKMCNIIGSFLSGLPFKYVPSHKVTAPKEGLRNPLSSMHRDSQEVFGQLPLLCAASTRSIAHGMMGKE